MYRIAIHLYHEQKIGVKGKDAAVGGTTEGWRSTSRMHTIEAGTAWRDTSSFGVREVSIGSVANSGGNPLLWRMGGGDRRPTAPRGVSVPLRHRISMFPVIVHGLWPGSSVSSP
jgi:hypothetical protein